MNHRPRRLVDSFTSKFFGAALSLSSLEACDDPKPKTEITDTHLDTKDDAGEYKKETAAERTKGIETLEPTDTMKKEWYEKLPDVDYAVLRMHLPELMRKLSDKELTAELKKMIADISGRVEADIAQARFANKAFEEKYFSRLRNEKMRHRIQTAVAHASSITGVPEDLLIAIGCTESQWDEDAENTGTEVYGPMQMKLNTAKQIAEQMNKKYGLSIIIEEPKDLKDIETGVMLAAGHLEQLTLKYNDTGLATAAYASGSAALDGKIHTLFPDIDLGQEAEQQRIRHSKGIQEVSEKIKIIKTKKKLLPQDQITLKSLRRLWTEHNDGYKVSLEKQQKALKNLPTELVKHGVSIYTLFSEKITSPDGESGGFSDKHSLEYAINIDAMAALAAEYMEKE